MITVTQFPKKKESKMKFRIQHSLKIELLSYTFPIKVHTVFSISLLSTKLKKDQWQPWSKLAPLKQSLLSMTRLWMRWH